MDPQAARSLSKKRTTNFGEVETKLLIQLWGSSQIQNKLYLTHRKAPVMRILAHNMQQRGFFRTPDEIKTRIRNLKCLYHRIKRSMKGHVIPVEPDWPHFKAMDEILSKKNVQKDLYENNVFEGPRCEDIKQEYEEIDINDESFGGSDFEDDTIPLPALTPAPAPQPPKEMPILKVIKEAKEKPDKETTPTVTRLPTILPNLQIPIPNQTVRGGNPGQPMPFPLLILNGMPGQSMANQDKKDKTDSKQTLVDTAQMQEISTTIKELLTIQREKLDLEREKLELNKQKHEFNRLVGTQLLSLIPMFGAILQNVTDSPKKAGKKRGAAEAGFDILKASKILRNDFEEALQKYLIKNHVAKSESDSEEEEGESEK